MRLRNKRYRIALTEDEAFLLLPSLKAAHTMDLGDPEMAPPGAAKNWESMIGKLETAMGAKNANPAMPESQVSS